MKGIVKNDEPVAFGMWKSGIIDILGENPDWNAAWQLRKDLFSKSDLRSVLLEEQGYICCYCCSRIENRGENRANPQQDFTVVEHFKPKDISQFPEFTFHYPNLFASCDGGRSFADNDEVKDPEMPKEKAFCDNAKNNSYVSAEGHELISPSEKDEQGNFLCEKLIRFSLTDGSCFAGENDARADFTIRTLQLNHKVLKRRRVAALSEIFPDFADPSYSSLELSKEEIQIFINHYESKNPENGHFEPFCDFVLSYLKALLNKFSTP
jgi:uncharacterized protein (TIGR02646 family)